MLILGIESSCDDMAAAVVEDGKRILSNVVSSQDEIHRRYGGVVPELASRRHLETVIPVVEATLTEAGVTLGHIHGIGVTQGPGLVGSILVGLSFAKAVAYVKGIPFVGVNHLEAHPMAVFLEPVVRIEKDNLSLTPSPLPPAPNFPFIALVVSGGHTALLRFRDFGDYEVMGQTRDDAAGEAFDKVAKLLGLGYPGGVAIDRLASRGDPEAIGFSRPYISKDTFDFSFSGLKTAVLKFVKDKKDIQGVINNLAASFQEAVVDVLVDKAFHACNTTGVNRLVVAGGVACNSRLRGRLLERAGSEGVEVFIPPPFLCSDNGAMVAVVAYHLLKKGRRSSPSLNASPSY